MAVIINVAQKLEWGINITPQKGSNWGHSHNLLKREKFKRNLIATLVIRVYHPEN